MRARHLTDSHQSKSALLIAAYEMGVALWVVSLREESVSHERDIGRISERKRGRPKTDELDTSAAD
jgi:hypothetical protein